MCGIWTFAFSVKVIAVYEGQYLIGVENDDFYTAVTFASTEFISVIIPFYCVVDQDFVATLTCKHLLAG